MFRHKIATRADARQARKHRKHTGTVPQPAHCRTFLLNIASLTHLTPRKTCHTPTEGTRRRKGVLFTKEVALAR